MAQEEPLPPGTGQGLPSVRCPQTAWRVQWRLAGSHSWSCWRQAWAAEGLPCFRCSRCALATGLGPPCALRP